MTALQLYKFIQKHHLEIDWRGEELLLWVEFRCIDEFARMINSVLDEGGIQVHLRVDCVVFDIVELCEWFDIDPEEILEKPEHDYWQ
jgi:hypothetical protein